MKNSTEEYFEILLEPYACYEGFVDFVVDQIEAIIEEISTPYPLQTQESDIENLDLMCFFSETQRCFHQIIIRTFKNPLEILELLREFAQKLSSALDQKVDFGFGFRVRKNQDWIDAYKRSITPISVGQFYIRPSWFPKTQLDLMDIVIDPALAFGSGHHATTAMCLEFLSEINLANKSLLDLGCGSGILGIAAKMLGARVEICDTDSLAIQESHKNFVLNGCSVDASWIGSISESRNTYDLIVSNLLTHVILMLWNDFYLKLKMGGILILSGILSEHKEKILLRFKDFELLAIQEKDQWVALKLLKFK